MVKKTVFRHVDECPGSFTSPLCPTNVEEEKERFFKLGVTPKFLLRSNSGHALKTLSSGRGQIKFDLFGEAKYILDTVKAKFGDGAQFINHNYGQCISQEVASEHITEYLEAHNLQGEMTVVWAGNLTCTARMMWHGPNVRLNHPELRKYTLLVKSNHENAFLRQCGIPCLMDHEVGTHYFRMVNDGLQPWFSDRSKFGLRQQHAREFVAAEEGLAAINTVLGARTKYLWSAALVYYTSCMAASLTFRGLFDHLEQYVKSPEQRFRHCMRVKRGVTEADGLGGYGNDQCYFEGAVEILRNMNTIDFPVMYAGRLCVDEVHRVRRVARMDCIKLPIFLNDVEKYKRSLRHIAVLNGLIERPTPIPLTITTSSKRRQVNEKDSIESVSSAKHQSNNCRSEMASSSCSNAFVSKKFRNKKYLETESDSRLLTRPQSLPSKFKKKGRH